ncbi:MAG: NYN domain-containing protein [Candidatus Omnitrophica bacterium]|nr:NYN domain-containing protein [Candidatus Omnitrophota bacterium]
MNQDSGIIRISVFYDGTFYSKLSSYYKYQHKRQSNLTFTGLHEFVRHKIAEKEQIDVVFCQIVEAHFFRGRFSLTAAKNANSLEPDRFLDQLLMHAAIVSHYYPMNENVTPPVEKGIDVWLALEAYDLAVHKRFDVLVLVTGDQDFIPLVRKVNGIGTRVMLLTDDVKWRDDNGNDRYINTSQRLIDEASYPILLSNEIDARTAKNDRIIDGLFQK